MSIISLVNVITDVFNIKNPPLLFDWKYPLTKKILKNYNFSTAQSLFELSYILTQYNKSPVLDYNPPNFDIIIPLNCKLFTRTVNIGMFLYSTSLDIIAVVFTGTYDDILVTSDIDYFQIDIGDNVKCHSGFYKLYTSIENDLHECFQEYTKENTQIIFTGYSLGGAMSTLAMFKFDQDLTKEVVHYSFASPRLFNVFGANLYNSKNFSSYRICNNSDIITNFPLPVMLDEFFLHVKDCIYFDINLGSYFKNHIDAYVKKFNL